MADFDIVSEVAAHHQQIAIPHAGMAAIAGAAMDRDMLADDVVTSDLDATLDPAIEAQVLRIGPDDRAVPDFAPFAEGDPPHQLGVTTDDATAADADTGFNDRERSDFDLFAELCAGIDDGSGVDFQENGRRRERRGDLTD
jgi:hypothetical protein